METCQCQDRVTTVTRRPRTTDERAHLPPRRPEPHASVRRGRPDGREGRGRLLAARGRSARRRLPRGAPAHHFGDATGLLTAVSIDAFNHLHQRHPGRVRRATTTPLERLAKVGRAYVELAVSHPGHCAVMLRTDLVDSDVPEWSRASELAYGVLESTLDRRWPRRSTPISTSRSPPRRAGRRCRA